jgi:hypothetical protein
MRYGGNDQGRRHRPAAGGCPRNGWRKRLYHRRRAASLRECRLAVSARSKLRARKPALLVRPDRTCGAARPFAGSGRPHRWADRYGAEPLRRPRKEQILPSPQLPTAPTHGSCNSVKEQPRNGPPYMLRCRSGAQALKIAESFGATIVNSDGIRSLDKSLIVKTADSRSEDLCEKVMQIHLQRILGALVGSAMWLLLPQSPALPSAQSGRALLQSQQTDAARRNKRRRTTRTARTHIEHAPIRIPTWRVRRFDVHIAALLRPDRRRLCLLSKT